MDDMLETMYEAPGIGLGCSSNWNFKKIDSELIYQKRKKKNPLFLINPKITFKSKEYINL